MQEDSELPRFTKLDQFYAHRPTFECKHEADANPPVTPEAEALFQQALALDNHDLWAEQRDYPRVVQLYEQAMKLGHWKAQFNLAGFYLKGVGVEQNDEKAIELTEDLMTKGVPAAWDNMGTYYTGGVGSLKRDATVAYAFWQKAADMGSMASQAYIGAKLRGTHDEPPSFWGNRPIAFKMLECAFAQGSGDAALALGVALHSDDPSRALRTLHEGVKFGSERTANALFASFDDGSDPVRSGPDTSRARRYKVLADALYTNPFIKYPNLDKVLPLPPAALPKWDGNKETLIDAAKAVVPVPPAPTEPPPSPASQRTGRAHMPEGHVLPEKLAMPVPAQHESTAALVSGYWLAQLMHPRNEQHAQWNADQMPLRYARDELFDRTRPGLLPEDGRILFHFKGEPIAQPAPKVVSANPRVTQGVAREAVEPEHAQRCWGEMACPATGIWHGSVSEAHPLAATFNQWHRQSYVLQGEPFPDPRDMHLDVEPVQVSWQWWGQANREGPVGITHVGVGNPPSTA
ncbi:sel1 repeat family protein [Variovorax paradoxus]|uniref:Sel1 repeat family protein n=1 Tax=Variovorax paradoxus TaxID=34073 RepID=A0A5Q0MFJ4_VARPD|nr:DUF6396 domain-containing protein [Variovorax paradoxus]QFZ87192.1 sel1 repeat family protein [Variovorax paradoxus]